jgi:hypothetical protein
LATPTARFHKIPAGALQLDMHFNCSTLFLITGFDGTDWRDHSAKFQPATAGADFDVS